MTEGERRCAEKRIAGRCAGDRHVEPAAVQLDPVRPQKGRSDATAWRRRGGNPLGNPGLNLAPRCGARTRKGCACRAPAMANGRCRMHGGRSTGPRTPEGKAARTAAHTTHGHRAAPQRKALRATRTLVSRMRLYAAVLRLGRYVPAEMMARLAQYPLAFLPPEKPFEVVVSANAPRTPYTCLPPVRRMSRARTGGAVGLALTGRAAERAAVLAEAALQAPWQQAVAFARAVKRTVQAEKRDVRAARRAAWAARQVVGAVALVGRERGESGEAGAVRLNPTQLSRNRGVAAGDAGGGGREAGCGAATRTGRTRAASEQLSGVRSNPTQLSPPAKAAASRDCLIGTLLGPPQGTQPRGRGGEETVDCGWSGREGQSRGADGAALNHTASATGVDAGTVARRAWLNPANRAALGSRPLVAGEQPDLRARLAALFGAAPPPAGWRVPQAWPPTGGLGGGVSRGGVSGQAEAIAAFPVRPKRF